MVFIFPQEFASNVMFLLPLCEPRHSYSWTVSFDVRNVGCNLIDPGVPHDILKLAGVELDAHLLMLDRNAVLVGVNLGVVRSSECHLDLDAEGIYQVVVILVTRVEQKLHLLEDDRRIDHLVDSVLQVRALSISHHALWNVHCTFVIPVNTYVLDLLQLNDG